MDGDGVVTTKIRLKQPVVKGIEGMEFSSNKVERQGEEFNIEFAFNNIDFDFLPNTETDSPEFEIEGEN